MSGLSDFASGVGGDAKDTAMQEGSDMANDLIADAKEGKAPNPAAIKDKAADAGKQIAQNTGAAAIDSAKDKANQEVDKALGAISNEFPILGGILGVLAKPIIDHALDQCKMPDF